MNLAKLSRSPRAIKALTGLSYDEFTTLVPLFTHAIYTLKAERKDRRRGVGGGQKGKLPTPEHKLFFILFYYKVYPTFDVMGFLFDKSRNRSHTAVRDLTRALERALGRRLVLPARKINSVEEFLEKFPEAKDVFIDGGERRTERPKNPKSEHRTYSGKKKAHTRKNIVMCDADRRILFVSPTKSGRRHDKRLADKCALVERIPPSVGIFADSGFQGIHRQHPNTAVPKRGRKNAPLTEAERANNRIISSLRIVIEHAIGGMKRFHILQDRFRNRCRRFEDTVVALCAGLWNFHLIPSTTNLSE